MKRKDHACRSSLSRQGFCDLQMAPTAHCYFNGGMLSAGTRLQQSGAHQLPVQAPAHSAERAGVVTWGAHEAQRLIRALVQQQRLLPCMHAFAVSGSAKHAQCCCAADLRSASGVQRRAPGRMQCHKG